MNTPKGFTKRVWSDEFKAINDIFKGVKGQVTDCEIKVNFHVDGKKIEVKIATIADVTTNVNINQVTPVTINQVTPASLD